MKSVLISIRPGWCGLIASGRKTIEVRKSRPKLETPFKCYIYETKSKTNTPLGPICGRGKVIGEFTCNEIEQFSTAKYAEWQTISSEDMCKQSCLTLDELHDYECNGLKPEGLNFIGLYGWHISDLFIYDKPMELSEFMKPCKNDLFCEVCAMYHEFEERCGNGALMIKRAPQSWCYVIGGADHAAD